MFHLRGTKGNFRKWAPDIQEVELNKITRIESETWGQEPAANWGTLTVDADGAMVTRTVESIPGDYRLYYEGIRDALLGKAPFPCRPWLPGAWRDCSSGPKKALSSDGRLSATGARNRQG